jgi:hypothetical protein
MHTHVQSVQSSTCVQIQSILLKAPTAKLTARLQPPPPPSGRSFAPGTHRVLLPAWKHCYNEAPLLGASLICDCALLL